MPDGLDILIDWCGKSLRVVSVSQQIDFGGKNRKLVASLLRGVMEMDQNTRREQTKAGLEAAKSRGVRLGRPSVVGSAKVTQAKKMRKKGKRLVDIAEALDISKTTAGRYVNL